jgi:hypothetical protein
MVVLYTNLEDLIAENDHRYEEQESTREYVFFFILRRVQFYHLDRTTCNMAISYSCRFCLGCMRGSQNLTSMTVKT